VLDAVAAANGAPLNIVEAERRAGDPPALVAGADKVREVLGWTPRYDNLSTIASSSLAWERSQCETPWRNE
jgi:UDP-glucose 4-epimerase